MEQQEARDNAVAAAWGFAEATFLPIAPDVWLSWVAARSPRNAPVATLAAIAGAVAGGVVSHRLGRSLSAAVSRRLLRAIPGVSEAMVDRVEQEMAAGTSRVVFGPIKGTPYKIYARTAGLQRHPLPVFLGWTVPARLPRFALVALAAAGLGAAARRTFPGASPRLGPLALGACWVAFYAWYFRNIGDGLALGGRPRAGRPAGGDDRTH